MPKPVQPAPPLQATTLASVPGHYLFAAWQNLSIVVWVRQADLSAVLKLAAISQQMQERHPRGHSSISCVLNGVGGPAPDAAAALGRLMNGPGADRVCTAVVIEGEGFWASRMRSAITNMQLSNTG